MGLLPANHCEACEAPAGEVGRAPLPGDVGLPPGDATVSADPASRSATNFSNKTPPDSSAWQGSRCTVFQVVRKLNSNCVMKLKFQNAYSNSKTYCLMVGDVAT